MHCCKIEEGTKKECQNEPKWAINHLTLPYQEVQSCTNCVGELLTLDEDSPTDARFEFVVTALEE